MFITTTYAYLKKNSHHIHFPARHDVQNLVMDGIYDENNYPKDSVRVNKYKLFIFI